MLPEALAEAAADGGLIAYFGYGSLVNRATHRTATVGAWPCRLRGWRRCWQPRPDMERDPPGERRLALLTVRRDDRAAVDGLLVFDRAENLPAIDAREARYDRRRISLHAIEGMSGPLPQGCPLFVYEARPAPAYAARAPILQSYLDAVLQGFLLEHGTVGVRDFVFETEGFDTTILADRHAPVYPRAVTLAPDDQTLFDALLAERGVRICDP